MRKHKGRTRLRQRDGSAKLTPYAFSQTSSRCWFASWLPPAARILLRRPSRPTLSASFRIFPCLPDAKFVSRAGSEDALQVTLYTPTQARQGGRVLSGRAESRKVAAGKRYEEAGRDDRAVCRAGRPAPLGQCVADHRQRRNHGAAGGSGCESRFGEGRSRGAEGGRQLGGFAPNPHPACPQSGASEDRSTGPRNRWDRCDSSPGSVRWRPPRPARADTSPPDRPSESHQRSV